MDGLSDILSNLGNLGGGEGGSLLDKLGGLLGGDNAEGGSLLDKLGDLVGGDNSGEGESLLDKLGGLFDNGEEGGLLDKLKDLISGGANSDEVQGSTTPDAGGQDSVMGDVSEPDTTVPGSSGEEIGSDSTVSGSTEEKPGWHINPPTNTTGDPNQPLTLPPTHIDPQTGLQVVDPLIGGTEPGDAGDAADTAQGAYPDYILELPERTQEAPVPAGQNGDPTAGGVINAAVQQRLLFESQQINEGLM